MPLKDLKEINPVDLTKYVVENRIDHEPEFAWWVPLTLRKQNMRVSKLQNKYWCITHKFGIEVPTSVKWEYNIYDDTGTCFWRKSITKKIMKVKVDYVEKEKAPE